MVYGIDFFAGIPLVCLVLVAVEQPWGWPAWLTPQDLRPGRCTAKILDQDCCVQLLGQVNLKTTQPNRAIMPIKRFFIGIAAGVFTLVGTAFAAGHLPQEQQRAIEARQSHMTLYQFNLRKVGGMAQERMPYDAEVAALAAANLAALAAMNEAGYWVEGTDTSIEGSRAKPEIWSDMAGFEAEQVKLTTATAALAEVAGDGLDAMKAAFAPVGQSCGSCHETYRAPPE